jgi:hypothetical protein
VNVWGRLVKIASDVGLGVVFAAVLVFEAVRVAASWGGNYWQFNLATGTVVCVIALLRRRDRARAAVAGLTVAAVAVLVARSAQLPSQPGPAMALALSVLVAAGIRTLPPRPASAVAAAGLVVAAGSLLTVHGPSSVSLVVTVNGVGWSAAVATGLLRRLRGTRRQAILEKVRRDDASSWLGSCTTSSPTTSPGSCCRPRRPGSRTASTRSSSRAR